MIDKNKRIQEMTMYFKVGLKSLPLFRFQIDTNKTNAKGRLDYMNQLESWAKNNIITLHFSSTVLSEIQKPGIGHTRKQEISKRISGELFTMEFAEDEERKSFKMIENILFPNGCKDENQKNDVRIVFHAYKHHYILITNDGDSKSQPTGILGNAQILKDILRINIMRDSEAVDMVR